MEELLKLMRLKAEILAETSKAIEISKKVIELQNQLLLMHGQLLNQISHIIEITEQFQ